MKALLVLALLAAPAHADEDVVEDSYRYQVIVSDAASISVALVGAAVGGDGGDIRPWLVASAVTYTLGAPTIHGVHGNLAHAGISLGVRVSLPLLGMGIGSLAAGNECDGSPSPCNELGSEKVGYGIAIGVLAAMVIDAGVIARPIRRSLATPAVTPTMSTTPGGATFGLAGAF